MVPLHSERLRLGRRQFLESRNYRRQATGRERVHRHYVSQLQFRRLLRGTDYRRIFLGHHRGPDRPKARFQCHDSDRWNFCLCRGRVTKFCNVLLTLGCNWYSCRWKCPCGQYYILGVHPTRTAVDVDEPFGLVEPGASDCLAVGMGIPRELRLRELRGTLLCAIQHGLVSKQPFPRETSSLMILTKLSPGAMS